MFVARENKAIILVIVLYLVLSLALIMMRVLCAFKI